MNSNVVLEAQKALIDRIKVVLSSFVQKDVMVFIDSAEEITMPYVKISNIIIHDDTPMSVISDINFTIHIVSNARSNKEVIELSHCLKEEMSHDENIVDLKNMSYRIGKRITISEKKENHGWESEINILVQPRGEFKVVEI